jgi:hypothetical protein
MKVQYSIRQQVEKDVAQLVITVPLDEVTHEDHAEWPMPEAIHHQANTVNVRVCVETGRIVGWPTGKTYNELWKPRDSGTYTLLDGAGGEIEVFADDYVPAFCGWGEGGGDYIEMKIDENGTIANFHDAFTAEDVWLALDDKYADED